ncbi:tyrosine-type recombinase/integrase [Candidatus Brocadia sp. AMX2]|uniref:tyrosine-type recombinase/integrase n=1 Tax=Candidatus Brocadia sp. AMX2 TaxID=2293635 RepID=UPI0025571F61|nr:site-specific integrase [Candidatus Brocadia sp. AMX2]
MIKKSLKRLLPMYAKAYIILDTVQRTPSSITYGGRRIRRSTGTPKLELAKAIEAKLRTELIEGKYFDRCEGEEKTFQDMADRFMLEYAPKNSKRTQMHYKTTLGHALPFFGNMKLTSITPKRIAEYKAMRYSRGIKPGTFNLERAMFSKMFNVAIREWEWLKENSVSKVSRDRENNHRDRWLSIEDERRLLENMPEWLREIVLLALHTGLRQDELLSLTWDRANLLQRTIVIQKSKNGRARTIPLTSVAMGILEEKARIRNLKTDLVFTNTIGKKIGKSWVLENFIIARKKAGLDDFHFHDLRHTFATRLAQRGVDLYTISKLLGHVNIAMTQRYAHHCQESLRAGIAVLENSGHDLVTVGEIRNVSNA